jgi:hypothetical protein
MTAQELDRMLRNIPMNNKGTQEWLLRIIATILIEILRKVEDK